MVIGLKRQIGNSYSGKSMQIMLKCRHVDSNFVGFILSLSFQHTSLLSVDGGWPLSQLVYITGALSDQRNKLSDFLSLSPIQKGLVSLAVMAMK